VYYNHNHFEQNSIAAVETGVEGFSEAFKNRLVIPVRYSEYDINHLIAHEYVHIAQFEILYGGFWKSARLIKGLSGLEPLWIMEGIAESVSHRILDIDWSSYDSMILRDAVIYDYLYRLRELQNFNALYRKVYLGYKEGHSAMDYLMQEEGEDIYFRLLKSMRNNLDPVKAFETAADKFASFNDFDIKWRKDLKRRINEFIVDKERAEDSAKIHIEDHYDSLNPVWAEDKSFYYVSDRWVMSEIYLHEEGSDTKILPSFFGSKVRFLIEGRRFDRKIDYNNKKKILVFAARHNHKERLFIYNTLSGKAVQIKLQLHEIRSPALSSEGNLIVFTALKDSSRNIYTYNIDTGTLKKITDDPYIDYAPVFSPDSTKILASTERDLNTDLRLIDIHSSSSTWLTQTPYNEIHPVFENEHSILLSADRNSVYNIYRIELSSPSPTQLTNVQSGVFFPASYSKDSFLSSCYFNESFKICEFQKSRKKQLQDTSRRYFDKPVKTTPDKSLIVDGKFKKKFSTDFFLPSFFYSTDIGFVGGVYYKISDILANHTIDFYGWAWPGTYETSIGYTIKKFRPDIHIMALSKGENYLIVDDEEEEVEEEFEEYFHGLSLSCSYPLDSFWSISNWIHASTDDEENKLTREKFHDTETGLGIQISRSTALLEPFNVIRGSLLSLSAYAARPAEKFGLDYNIYDISYNKYFPFSHRLTWANRIYLAASEGEDAHEFKLGSNANIVTPTRHTLRGYPTSSFVGRKLTTLNTELRFLLIPKINGHIYFMWPDINFYSFSVKLFSDAGTAFDEDFPQKDDEIGYSWGFGFKLNIYILQLAPFYINAEFARPYDTVKWKNQWMFYTGFVTW
ncbi:hypothetical protein ACFLTD_03875, partial [Elusimicrobiota bacterium]